MALAAIANKIKKQILKLTLRIFTGIILSMILSSNRPIVLIVDLKLVESGWDRHFENHKSDSNQPHLDFGKFQTLDERETYMVYFILPKDFDSKTLRKGNTFEVGLAHFGDIESLNEKLGINVKNKKDLERHEIRMMMGLKPK